MSMFQYSWISASKSMEADIQYIGTGSSGDGNIKKAEKPV
jgi:hypothetical protein